MISTCHRRHRERLSHHSASVGITRRSLFLTRLWFLVCHQEARQQAAAAAEEKATEEVRAIIIIIVIIIIIMIIIIIGRNSA